MRHLSRIAWSRNGLVAYIDDSQRVRVTWLRCVDGEHWDWVPSVAVPYPADSSPAMLCWANTNSDLAIADELGRIQIVSLTTDAPPKTHIVASAVRDDRKTAIELDRIVAMHWLPPEKSLIVPEVDATGKPWQSVPPRGPFHPLKGAGALLAINGNGMLRMLLQSPPMRYVEFDALVPNAHCVSHASFLPLGGNTLLAVLVNEDDSTLMAYEVTIKLEPLANWSTKPDFATLKIHPVASVKVPQGPVDLGLFRSVSDDKIEAWLVYKQEVLTFEIVSSEEALHVAFFELFSTSDPVSPEPLKVWQINSQEPQKFESPIVELVVQRFRVLLVHANGLITSKNLLGNNALELNVAGLSFDAEDLKTADVICLSPTACCAAILKADDGPKLISARLHAPVDNAAAKGLALSLATYYACVTFNSDQNDDLLNVGRSVYAQLDGEQAEVFFDTASRESQRLLSISLGPLDDPHKVERLLVIPSPLQRWLAFLISLGTSEGYKRTPACYMAWSLLHLQLIALGITWTMKRLSQKAKLEITEASRAEIHAIKYHIDAIMGPLKWATDLIVRISQEMYDASLTESPADLLAGRPNVFAVLLTASVPRYLLRFFLKGVRSLTSAAKNLAEQEVRINALISRQAQETQDATLARELRAKLALLSNYSASQTLKKIVYQLQSMPVKLDSFENVVTELDAFMKQHTQQMDSSKRAALDSELVRHARLPASFKTAVVPRLMALIQKNIFSAADVPVMYFYDTTWLALDEVSYPYMVDGLRKRVILPTEETQKCARCGLLSVRPTDLPKGMVQWLQIFNRQCICGGSWIHQIDIKHRPGE